MNPRQIVATICAVIAAIAFGQSLSIDNEPTPAPPPASTLDLRGKFVGEFASDDCLAFGCLCDSLAEMIEWDGMQSAPRLTTGAAIDDLRKLAREFRMSGVSIGSRQPVAADAIASFLTAQVGTDGGPVGPKQRSAWVAAFREIARACSHAVER